MDDGLYTEIRNYLREFSNSGTYPEAKLLLVPGFSEITEEQLITDIVLTLKPLMTKILFSSDLVYRA